MPLQDLVDRLKREAKVVTTNELASELLYPKPPLKTEADDQALFPLEHLLPRRLVRTPALAPQAVNTGLVVSPLPFA